MWYYLISALIKGTVSRDFLLLVLFMNQLPPSPRVFQDRFKFFSKIQGVPLVSLCSTCQREKV
jgi:hypothetical protein